MLSISQVVLKFSGTPMIPKNIFQCLYGLIILKIFISFLILVDIGGCGFKHVCTVQTLTQTFLIKSSQL